MSLKGTGGFTLATEDYVRHPLKINLLLKWGYRVVKMRIIPTILILHKAQNPPLS